MPPDLEIAAIKERMLIMEFTAAGIEKRLKEGAASFTSLRESLENVREDIQLERKEFQEAIKPRPVATWKIISTSLGLLVVVIAWVWQAAKYPDRDEFNAAKAETVQAQKEIQTEVVTIKSLQTQLGANQMLIKSSVERQEKSQEKIDNKLNAILEAPRRR